MKDFPFFLVLWSVFATVASGYSQAAPVPLQAGREVRLGSAQGVILERERVVIETYRDFYRVVMECDFRGTRKARVRMGFPDGNFGDGMMM